MTAETHDTGPAKEPTTPPKGCDLDEIDALTCTAKKIQKQAEVTNESLQKLDTRRGEFKDAKAAYTTAWATAQADADAATAKLTPRMKELACCLADKDRQCLDEVWEKIKTEIRTCTGPSGCRQFDCNFDQSVGEKDTPATLAGRISELRQRAQDLDDYFGDLVKEQTKLPANAAAARQIVETLVGDTTSNDWVKLYARAVVAEWTIANVWDGFTSVQDYLDCLCQILTCLLKAWEAIVALEGALAERLCSDGRKQDRCDTLSADPVAEILERYEKECAHSDDKSPAGAALTS